MQVNLITPSTITRKNCNLIAIHFNLIFNINIHYAVYNQDMNLYESHLNSIVNFGANAFHVKWLEKMGYIGIDNCLLLYTTVFEYLTLQVKK